MVASLLYSYNEAVFTSLVGQRLLPGDKPLSALLVVGSSVSLVILPQGCLGMAVTLFLEPCDLVVWCYDMVHGGNGRAEAAGGVMRAAGRRGADESAEDDRIHTYIDSPAHEREGDSTEKCDDAHLSGSGFKTARVITARADVLASLVRPPLWAVHEFGIVVIPACSELGRKAATALSRAPPTNKWNKIFNGRTNTGQQDRRRHAWPLAAGLASDVQDGVASVLGAAGLLQCDPAGPWAGGLKDVREATALRCLAGCPPQPVHADVSKDCLRYGLQ